MGIHAGLGALDRSLVPSKSHIHLFLQRDLAMGSLTLGILVHLLRMVSWHLTTMRFGGDEGHTFIIL